MPTEPRAFRIDVTVQRGHIAVLPDPAVVIKGTLVEWHIAVLPQLPPIEFELYFADRSPTHWSRKRMALPRHSVPKVISAVADDSGEFKYGVKAIDLDSKQVIADDDPYLIVHAK